MYIKPFVVAKLICILSSKVAPTSSLLSKNGLLSYKTLGLNNAFPEDKNPHRLGHQSPNYITGSIQVITPGVTAK